MLVPDYAQMERDSEISEMASRGGRAKALSEIFESMCPKCQEKIKKIMDADTHEDNVKYVNDMKADIQAKIEGISWKLDTKIDGMTAEGIKLEIRKYEAEMADWDRQLEEDKL